MRNRAALWTTVAALCVFLIGVGTPVLAKKDGALYGVPIYFEPNDTYYELVSIKSAHRDQIPAGVTSWNTVRKLARQHIYKGRRGRLAIVNSKELNDFLRDKFKPDRPTWIGLRYNCKYRKFIWVDGRVLGRRDYRNFGTPWNIWGAGNYINSGTVPDSSTRRCYKGWMPIHYWPVNDSGYWSLGDKSFKGSGRGFHWNANGYAKFFGAFFVEYPPPKKAKKTE